MRAAAVRRSARFPLSDVGTDVFAFGVGLALAYFLKWETRDLVWSLWLCSLVLGYLTLLSAIAAGVWAGLRAGSGEDGPGTGRAPMAGGALAGGLFMFCFFSFHFCGFHAGHSVFLMQFFPLEGLPRDGFGRAFPNPPLLWILVFRHLMRPYGLFLIPAVLAERHHVFQPIAAAFRAARGRPAPNPSPEAGSRRDPPASAQERVRNALFGPYLNVVRMHLLIFFFAFCHILKLDSFLVYAVVYAVYFFPWGALARARFP